MHSRRIRIRDSRQPESRRHSDILVVCTGNICRSPYVAAVLADALPALTVRSAGTNAVVGRGPVPPILAAVDELGLPTPPPGLQLRRSMIRRAHAVITMTQAHRVVVLTTMPKAATRTFTLKELARVSRDFTSTSTDVHDRLSDLIRHAGSELSRAAREHDDDDIDDPFGGPLAGYAVMRQEADDAMRAIITAIRGEDVR